MQAVTRHSLLPRLPTLLHPRGLSLPMTKVFSFSGLLGVPIGPRASCSCPRLLLPSPSPALLVLTPLVPDSEPNALQVESAQNIPPPPQPPPGKETKASGSAFHSSLGLELLYPFIQTSRGLRESRFCRSGAARKMKREAFLWLGHCFWVLWENIPWGTLGRGEGENRVGVACILSLQGQRDISSSS